MNENQNPNQQSNNQNVNPQNNNQNVNPQNNNPYMNPNANNQNNNPYTSSIGNMNQNVAALLAYLAAMAVRFIGFYFLAFIGPLLFVVLEKKNMFVKRHAGQALIIAVIETIIGLVFSFVGLSVTRLIKFDANTGITGLEAVSGVYMIVALVSGIISFALFIFTIIAMVKAYKNQDYEIPVIGKIAKSLIK